MICFSNAWSTIGVSATTSEVGSMIAATEVINHSEAVVRHCLVEGPEEVIDGGHE